EQLVAENPLRERLPHQLMLALYRSGRQADALEAFKTTRGVLVELGLQPGLPLQELEKAILRQDPELDLDGPHLSAVKGDTHGPTGLEANEAGETRKVVTVVFSHVREAATTDTPLDPEQAQEVMSRYFEEMRAALERHGGTPERFVGDIAICVFGVP